MTGSDALCEVAYGHEHCRRVARWKDAIDAIAENDRARRELIWLDAADKGDEASMRDLEHIDPGVRERLRWALQQVPRDAPTSARRAALQRLQDECFAFHARRLSPVPCRCPACAGTNG